MIIFWAHLPFLFQTCSPLKDAFQRMDSTIGGVRPGGSW